MFYIYSIFLKHCVKCVLIISSINAILDAQSGLGIFGQITLPTENEQISIPILTKPVENSETNNYESSEQSKRIQDLIISLSTALMKSFTNALLTETSKNVPRQSEYPRYPYSTYYQIPVNNFQQRNGIVDHPLLYRYLAPSQLSSLNYMPSGYNGMYGNSRNDWWPSITQQYPYGFTSGMRKAIPSYVYSGSPIRESQNQFDYGVSAGVYAGTYGGNKAISISDRDFDNNQVDSSYGGHFPWPFSFGNNGHNINLNSAGPSNFTKLNFTKVPRTEVKKIIGNGSVVQIPISEATGVNPDNTESNNEEIINENNK